MKSSEIIEEPKEMVKERMEAAVFDMEQVGDGMLCGVDTANALKTLRDQGFYRYGGHSVLLDGILIYYNHKKGRKVPAKLHLVGQVNDGWVIDIASKPGNRIYYNLEDYKERSGIELPITN